MIRVTSRIALVVFVLLSGLAWYSLYDYNDAQRLQQLDHTTYGTTFYLSGTQASKDDALRFFQRLSSDEGVSIDKVTAGLTDSAPSTVYSGVFYEDSFPVDQLRLESGRFPSDVDEFAASRESGDPHQVGTLFDFANNSPVTLQSLEAYFNKGGAVDGTYRIVSTRPIDTNAVLASIGGFFHIDTQSLLHRTMGQQTMVGAILPLSLFLIVLTVLVFVLLAIAYPISIARTIGIQKLLGWSNGDLWKAALGRTPRIAALSIVAVDAALLLIISPTDAMFAFSLVGIQLVAVALLVGASSVSLAVTRRLGAADMLKGLYPMKAPLVLGFILKGFMIATTTVLIAFIAPLFGDSLKNYSAQSAWQDNGQWYVMSRGASTAEDFESIAADDGRTEQAYGALYPLLNDTYQGVYAQGADAPPGGQYGYPHMIVNPNYLSQFPVYDQDGNQIAISEDEAARVVLVPASRADQAQAIADKELKIAQSGQEAAKRHQGGTAEAPHDVRAIIYRDDKPIFSFNTNAGASTGYYLDSPVFSIITEANIIDYERWNLMVDGADSPMKLSLNPRQKDDLEAYLADHGFADNHLTYVTLSDSLSEQFSLALSALGMSAAFLGAIFLVSTSADFFLAVVIVLAKRRLVAVERFLGYRFRDRYAREGVVLLVMYLLATVVVLAMSKSLLPVALVLVLLVLNAGIFAFFVGMREKKSFSDQLKEV